MEQLIHSALYNRDAANARFAYCLNSFNHPYFSGGRPGYTRATAKNQGLVVTSIVDGEGGTLLTWLANFDMSGMASVVSVLYYKVFMLYPALRVEAMEHKKDEEDA